MAHSGHNNDSMFKITVNLTLAALLSGVIIATVFYFTEPIAVIQRIRQKEQSMKELVPAATSFVKIEGMDEWYRAEKDGQLLAYVIMTGAKGFDGHIKMFMAATPDQKVIGYKVLSHRETPGLGDRAFKPKFMGQFAGRDYHSLEVVKIQEEGKITAITGATITSRAVTLAVKTALIELENYINNNKSK